MAESLNGSELKSFDTETNRAQSAFDEARRVFLEQKRTVDTLGKSLGDARVAMNQAEREMNACEASYVAAKRKKEGAVAGAQELVVSEHAMLRYVERVIGISLAELAESVCPESARKAMSVAGKNAEFPIGETHRIRIKNGVIVTVFAQDGEPD